MSTNWVFKRFDFTSMSFFQLVAQLESSELMVKTLQTQLTDLQKSETILKAKQHHDQVVRSLKERHETETYNMQQENDRLTLKMKHLVNSSVRTSLKSLFGTKLN